MGSATHLANRFVAALPPHQAPVAIDPEPIEATLAAMITEARQSWPDIALTDEQFVDYVAERVAEQGDVTSALARIRAADLFIAGAAAQGDAEAIGAVESHHFSALDAALGRLDIDRALVDEVKQTLREQLFVRSPARARPMIADYSGRGRLRNWLRVVAVRLVGRIVGKERREVPLREDVLEAVMAPVHDAELHHQKHAYRAEFREAFAASFRTLSARERNVLRQHYIDRLSIDDLGRLYTVHRATAARWLARAREALLDRTRTTLMERLGVGNREYDSIMGMIESDLDVTLRSIPESGE